MGKILEIITRDWQYNGYNYKRWVKYWIIIEMGKILEIDGQNAGDNYKR